MVDQKFNLEDAIEHTAQLISNVADMRKTLNVPTVAEALPFAVQIYGNSALAFAYYSNGRYGINMNILPFASQKQEKKEYHNLMKYFDYFREVIPTVNEQLILFFIQQDNPDMKATILKAYKNNKVHLEKQERFYKERGTSLEHYINFLEKYAKKTEQELSKVMPEIKKIFKESEEVFPVIAHEIDHIDMMNTRLYSDYTLINKKTFRLGFDLKKNSKIYAQSKLELLEKKSEILTLMEARAFIYSFMGKNLEKLKTDKGGLTKKIILRYIEGYVNHSFLEDMTDTLVSDKWAKGIMDRATSNYIFYEMNKQRDHEGADRYKIEPEKVNFKLANEILYQALPAWQKIFADNVTKATPVLVDALANRPEKFEKARQASTLKEYLDALKPKKPLILKKQSTTHTS